MTSNKTVLITGCSDGGIGSALALVLQQRGLHVFATARDPSKMSDLNGLPNVTMLTLDVVKPDQIKAAVDLVTKQTGGALDYLVNNAGRNHFMPILDEDLDVVKKLFDVNFYGPLAVTQAFAPLLVKAKGMAVYITSASGYINVPFMGKCPHVEHFSRPNVKRKGTYAASKRSLELAAETLRLELAPFGVDVLEVVTGAVKTRGQTYFGNFKLPEQSMYKKIEHVIASRAQGNDQLLRMETAEYAAAVADQIISRATGRFWYGNNAEETRMSTTATTVPQSAMVSPFYSCVSGIF
jgi:NAD(P)-dependent dehydrogenase (short-subunit alcohol dehydrogenase family)